MSLQGGRVIRPRSRSAERGSAPAGFVISVLQAGRFSVAMEATRIAEPLYIALQMESGKFSSIRRASPRAVVVLEHLYLVARAPQLKGRYEARHARAKHENLRSLWRSIKFDRPDIGRGSSEPE